MAPPKLLSPKQSGVIPATYRAKQTSLETGYTIHGTSKAKGGLLPLFRCLNGTYKARQGVITLDQAHLDLLDSILSFTSQALPPHLLSLYFRTHTATLPGPSFKQHQLWENGARRCKASSDAWVEIWIEMIRCLGQDGSSLDLELVRVIEVKVGDSIALMPISKKVDSSVLQGWGKLIGSRTAWLC
jgi:hypothetical protein